MTSTFEILGVLALVWWNALYRHPQSFWSTSAVGNNEPRLYTQRNRYQTVTSRVWIIALLEHIRLTNLRISILLNALQKAPTYPTPGSQYQIGAKSILHLRATFSKHQSIRRQKLKNRFLSYFAHKRLLVRLETWCGSFSPEALYFRKKQWGNRFSGLGGQNHRKLIFKISTINLNRAGKLKRGKKDRHFLLTEQVFFIN